jgi:RsiW-degrading membrane proteinase PrsW (M82 family)
MASPPEINPYAPPATNLDGAAPIAADAGDRFDRPLFSSGQIGAATFFASLLAGVLMLQANYRAMRRSGDANKTLALGLLAFCAWIALVMILPRGAQLPMNIGAVFAMSSVARSLQGQAFFNHTRAGGAKRSNWLVFAIIMGTFVAIFVAAMIFAFLTTAGSQGGLPGPEP